jgi:hypothetical protein
VEATVHAAFAREFRQPQRKARVRDDLRTVVREPRGGEPADQRVAVAGVEPVAAMKLRERDPFRRVFRVEVERQPDDVGVELAPCLLGRDLAEPAERSDVVAPDEDRVRCHDDIEASAAPAQP